MPTIFDCPANTKIFKGSWPSLLCSKVEAKTKSVANKARSGRQFGSTRNPLFYWLTNSSAGIDRMGQEFPRHANRKCKSVTFHHPLRPRQPHSKPHKTIFSIGLPETECHSFSHQQRHRNLQNHRKTGGRACRLDSSRRADQSAAFANIAVTLNFTH